MWYAGEGKVQVVSRVVVIKLSSTDTACSLEIKKKTRQG